VSASKVRALRFARKLFCVPEAGQWHLLFPKCYLPALAAAKTMSVEAWIKVSGDLLEESVAGMHGHNPVFHSR